MASKSKKRLSVSAGYTVAQVLAGTILTATLFGFVTRAEGIEVLGLWSLLLSLGSISRLMEMGLTGSITRFVATYTGRSMPVAATKVIGTAFVAVLVIMVVLMPLLYLCVSMFIHLIPGEMSESLLLSLFGYGLLGLALASVSSILLSGLDGLECFAERTLIVIFGQCVMTIVSLILLPIIGIFALIAGLVAQSLVTILLSIWRLCRSLNVNALFVAKFDLVIFKEIFSYGRTLLLTSLLMIFFEPVSKLLLLSFGGLGSVGYFEIANQIVQKIRSLFIASSQVLVPRFAAFNLNKNNDDKGLYRKVFEMFLPLALTAFSIVFVSRDIFALIFIGEISEMFNLILGVCCIAWGFNALSVPTYFYNIGVGKAKINFISFLMISVLNVALGFSLGAVFGLHGALFAYAFSLSVGTMYLLLNMQKVIDKSDRFQVSLSDLFLGFSLVLLISASSKISSFYYSLDLADLALVFLSTMFVLYMFMTNTNVKKTFDVLNIKMKLR